MPQEPAWYSRNLRRIFFDMHLPDWTEPGQSAGQITDLMDVATNFAPKKIVDEFKRAHVNAAVIFAKCQYGNFYYDTRIGHKHRGLGDLDFLGEILAEAHLNDIKIIGYYSNMWDTQIARQHPEWMALDANGERSYRRWPTLCLNSPYRDLVHQHLREMFTLYELDGVWSDILSALPCFCSRCQALYEEKHGEPQPRSPQDPGWIQMVRWQQDYLYDYIASCRSVVKEINPDAAYIVNFFGTPYAMPSQGLSFKHLPLSDMGSSEGYTEWHGLMFPSYAAKYMRAGTLGRPFEVLTGRFVHTWDFTIRSLAQMRYEAFSIIANGGAVCVDDEPYHNGQIEPLVFDHLENIFGEIKRREPYIWGTDPVLFAALYHSQKAREIDEVLNRSEPPSTSLVPGSNPNPAASDLLPSLMGAFKALQEAHIPVQFVDERPESLATLSQYRVVYLPNILALSETEADALRKYVQNGGGLVATGATSLFDDVGQQRENFLLADLFGVDVIERGAYTFPYFRFLPVEIANGLTDHPLPHYMAMWRVQLNSDAVHVAATRRDPLIETTEEVYYHNNQPAPGPDTGEPIVVYRSYGKGRVVYCAGLPESNFARLGYDPYRRLISNMIKWAADGEPTIQAEGLFNTEIVSSRLGNDLIVHLVTGMPQRSVLFGLHRTADTIEEQITLTNIRLSIPPQTTTAWQVSLNEALPIQRDGAQAWITLAQAGDWETIRLVGAGESGEEAV